MQKETYRRISQFAAAAVPAAVFVADRLLKAWFTARPEFHLEVIPGWFGLQLAFNFGIAFGLRLPLSLLWTLVCLVMAMVAYWLVRSWRRGEWIVVAGFTAIFLGALSNAIDRIAVGAVVDYIDVPWFTIFNLADSMITVGVGLLLLESVFRHRDLDKAKGV